MRPYIRCQGAARDVFGGLDLATDEAASVVLKIQNGSLNEEAVVPKDDEKAVSYTHLTLPTNREV